jgi:predicted amino acid dehydrogenase
LLKGVYIPWALRQFFVKNAKAIQGKKVAFYSSALQKPVLEVVEEFRVPTILADPYFFLKLPFHLRNNEQLERFLRITGPFAKGMDIAKSHVASFANEEGELPRHLKEFFDADIFVGNESILKLIDLNHLKGKTVIVDFLGPELEEKLRQIKVRDVIVSMPKVIDHPYVNFAILEAIFQAFGVDRQYLNEDDILAWIDRLGLSTRFKQIDSTQDDSISKFAFIIHPLGASHLFKHPLLRFLRPYSRPLESLAEDLMAFSPGFFYGTIKGIKSEKNGRDVEGLIYTVTETPRKLLEKDATTVYRKLISLCRKASSAGAGIIGLGAYTKIVGDAGVTVAKESPIPVTTGNSLSACSTLWAAKLALEKIGLVKRSEKVYQGRAMVIGATGSIGSVSAKILAQKWKEVVLVAPRAYKLLELREEIAAIAPECKIYVSTAAEVYASDCDLIITTTSSRGKKILDIMKVKPGCVICDVSRPFDIKEEDALKRPDVLVIASGEVQLPGEVEMNIDIGLEGNIVYACLAETALLAMEGKLENFTLGRNISYEKVLEIDRMAHEHGVRLSSIMGHSGFITDEEFDLCREHAKRALVTWEAKLEAEED